MFDISKLDSRARSESGVAMPISNPTTGAPFLDDAGKPVTITLRGPNSEIFKAKNRELQQRRVDMAARGVKMGPEDFTRERFDLLTAMTLGWSFDTMAGEAFPFSAANCDKFWSDGRWEWLQHQAWNFVQNDGNYLPL